MAEPSSRRFCSNPCHFISPSPLDQRLREWISEKASDEVARRFQPFVRKTLRDLDYDLDAPVSEDAFRRIQARLRKADITPQRMQHALAESQRAKREKMSTLEWIRSVEARAYSEELAERATELARERLREAADRQDVRLEKLPSPEEVFTFLLAWEEIGGTVTLAAQREIDRQAGDTPASN